MNKSGTQFSESFSEGIGNIILIVDDNPENLNILKSILQKHDYQVGSGISGKAALKSIRNDPPDLILLNIKIPGTDGYKICRQLKADEHTRDIPVLFISSMNDIIDRKKAFLMGADYITHPFQAEEVLGRVRTHLTLRHAQKLLSDKNVQEPGGTENAETTAGDSSRLLNEARQFSKEAETTKSEFLANMSHEIRTPMNSILGFSEILLDKTDDPEMKSLLLNIKSSGKALLTLINDILDLSKIEAGKLELQPEPVNIVGILNEVRQIFFHKLQDKGIDFKSDVSSGIPAELLLDEVRIRQILINLVGNAIKFTSHGYVKVSLYCKDEDVEKNSHDPVKTDSVSIIFEVEDTGIGISKDQQELIFENFQQQNGQKSRKYSGSGLGLAITKKLVRMMNGELSIKSEPGRGSSFRVVLFDVKVVDTSYLPSDRTDLISDMKNHPHTINPDTAECSPEETGQGETLSPEAIDMLPELIQVLKSEFMATWDDIRETLFIDEVEEFADQLKEQGEKYSCEPLVKWSEKVTRLMRSYDMEALAATFGKFPEIIQNFENYSNSQG